MERRSSGFGQGYARQSYRNPWRSVISIVLYIDCTGEKKRWGKFSWLKSLLE